MSLLLVLLVVLVLVSLGGGSLNPAYRTPGWSIGGVLLVVLVILLLSGRL